VREGETEGDGVNVGELDGDCVKDLVGVPVAVPPVENVEVVLGVRDTDGVPENDGVLVAVTDGVTELERLLD